MAEAVVDDLEAVEVEEEHGHHRPAVAETGEGGVEPLDRERAVRQIGERVVEGEMTEQLRVRGAVECDAHEAPDPFHHRLLGVRRLAGVPHVDRQHSEQARVVGRADGDRPEGPEAVRGGELTELAHLRERGVVLDVGDDQWLETRVVDVLGVARLLGQSSVDLRDEGRRQRRRRDPVQLTGFTVVEADRRGAVTDEFLDRLQEPVQRLGDGRAREDPFQHLGLAGSEGLDPPTFGDVAEVSDDAADRRLVHLVRARRLRPPPRAVGVEAPQFDRCALERAIGEGRDGVGRTVEIVGMDQVEDRTSQQVAPARIRTPPGPTG